MEQAINLIHTVRSCGLFSRGLLQEPTVVGSPDEELNQLRSLSVQRLEPAYVNEKEKFFGGPLDGGIAFAIQARIHFLLCADHNNWQLLKIIHHQSQCSSFLLSGSQFF